MMRVTRIRFPATRRKNLMFKLLSSGLLAGLIAGCLVFVLHLTLLQPLITQAEIFEEMSNSKSSENLAQDGKQNSSKPDTQHVHDGTEWSPHDGTERSLYTLMAHIITAIAYSLLLIAGFAIYGRNVSLLKGLLWGGAGFLSFSFLPGLGLPAELPGATRADLMDRQLWWLTTAFLSIVGFSMIAFGKANLLRFLGVIALALPHIYGAPGADSAVSGPSSPELAAKFVMLSLFVSAIMWIAISSMSVFIYMRTNVHRGFFSFLGR